jgi:hypothetical protein
LFFFLQITATTKTTQFVRKSVEIKNEDEENILINNNLKRRKVSESDNDDDILQIDESENNSPTKVVNPVKLEQTIDDVINKNTTAPSTSRINITQPLKTTTTKEKSTKMKATSKLTKQIQQQQPMTTPFDRMQRVDGRDFDDFINFLFITFVQTNQQFYKITIALLQY